MFEPWMEKALPYGGAAAMLFILSYVFNRSQDKKWEATYKQQQAAAEAEQKRWEATFAKQKTDAEAEQKRWDALFAERKEEADAERKTRKREQENWMDVRNREFELLTNTIKIIDKHTDAIVELTNHIKSGSACQLHEYSTRGKAL